MNDKIFIDTNILIYSISDEPQKRAIAHAVLLNHEIVVSPQVINEFVATGIRKRMLLQDQAVAYARQFMQIFEVTVMTQHTIASAFDVMVRYQFSYWDSLIVAAALEGQCLQLYTEDLQDGQQIEKRLTIYNPFLHD